MENLNTIYIIDPNVENLDELIFYLNNKKNSEIIILDGSNSKSVIRKLCAQYNEIVYITHIPDYEKSKFDDIIYVESLDFIDKAYIVATVTMYNHDKGGIRFGFQRYEMFGDIISGEKINCIDDDGNTIYLSEYIDEYASEINDGGGMVYETDKDGYVISTHRCKRYWVEQSDDFYDYTRIYITEDIDLSSNDNFKYFIKCLNNSDVEIKVVDKFKKYI